MTAPLPEPLLICAATEPELAAWPGVAPAERLLTGVGVPRALATLLRRLATGARPSLIVNVGIAGAYAGGGAEIGDVVLGAAEAYGDVGFELPEAPWFRPVAETPFGAEYRDPLPLAVPGWLAREGAGAAAEPPYRVHARVAGCTVNCCTGTDATGERRARLFGAAFETMEGAAVAQAGALFGVPVCEVRAVSNVAARRDMRSENVRRALASLAHYLGECAAGPRVQ